MQDPAAAPIPAPFVSEGLVVLPEWIDLNGHMNVARYLAVFDLALDRVYPLFGFDPQEMAAANAGTFTVEMHLTYRRELRQGDALRVTTQLMGFDDQRCHYLQCMYHAAEGFLAATSEWLMVYVDLTRRRAAIIPAILQQRLARVCDAHAALSAPPVVGRSVGLSNRRPG